MGIQRAQPHKLRHQGVVAVIYVLDWPNNFPQINQDSHVLHLIQNNNIVDVQQQDGNTISIFVDNEGFIRYRGDEAEVANRWYNAWGCASGHRLISAISKHC